ncbi:MAG TPA: apolipoprotein N-acyltransferase [Stellaceae bacterium]|nr:apolipoprotein N-acyltransferase [Stellaceae bacterium]
MIDAAQRISGPANRVRRWALRLSGLEGWRRYGLAFLLGALAAAALPPMDATPVLVISFTGLVWLGDGVRPRKAAFALGWSFGFGFFLAGLYWIGVALFVDIGQFWWFLPFVAVGFPAALALFPALSELAFFEASRRFHLSGYARILMLAACWTLSEWVRGHVFTGFPWNLVGYAWSGDFPGALAVLQVTSLIGIYGLSLFTVIAASLPARLGDIGVRPMRPMLALVLLVGIPGLWGAARLQGDEGAVVPGVKLRLVQPSIPQTLINDRASQRQNFDRLIALSRSAGWESITDIIWPEGASPPFLDRLSLHPESSTAALLASVTPKDGLLLLGSVRTDPLPASPEHFWNSLVALDEHGRIRGTYDKSHLVPFGEYVPGRGILPMHKVTAGTIDFSAGPGPRTLVLPGIPPVGPLICYEALFPEEVVNHASRPDWLLNLTNDAWYGVTSGPYQHLAVARVRAVEQGLPLIRSGNNGISAIIDAYGRVQARLPLNAVGALDGPLPQPLPPTVYFLYGIGIFPLIMLVILAVITIFSIYEE